MEFSENVNVSKTDQVCTRCHHHSYHWCFILAQGYMYPIIHHALTPTLWYSLYRSRELFPFVHPVFAFLPFSLWEAHQPDKCSLQMRDQYVLCPTKLFVSSPVWLSLLERPLVRLLLLLFFLLLLFLRLLLIIYICSAQVMQRGIQNRSPVNRRQSHAIGSLSLQRLPPIQSSLCKAEFQIWLTGDWWGHLEWCNAANRRTGAM